MNVTEKQVTVRKLSASEGHWIVRKGEETVFYKEVYLGMGDSEENYDEVPDSVKQAYDAEQLAKAQEAEERMRKEEEERRKEAEALLPDSERKEGEE